MYKRENLIPFLKEWRDKDFSNYNEDEICEEFVYPLLRFLGYKKNTINNLERNTYYKNIHPFLKTIMKGIKPDYVCSVYSKKSLVVEVKTPQKELSEYSYFQGYNYCLSPFLKARYLLVTNGKEFKLYSVKTQVPENEIVFHFSQPELLEFWNKIEQIISKAQIFGSSLHECLKEITELYTSSPHNERQQIIESLVPSFLKKMHFSSTPEESRGLFSAIDTLEMTWKNKANYEVINRAKSMKNMKWFQKLFILYLDLSYGNGVDIFELWYNYLIFIVKKTNYFEDFSNDETLSYRTEELESVKDWFEIKDSKIWLYQSFSDSVKVFHELDNYKTLFSLVDLFCDFLFYFNYEEIYDIYKEASLHHSISDIDAKHNTEFLYAGFSSPLVRVIEYAGQNPIEFTPFLKKILNENHPRLVTTIIQGMIRYYDKLIPSQQELCMNFLREIHQSPQHVQNNILMSLLTKAPDLHDFEQIALEKILSNDNEELRYYLADGIKYFYPFKHSILNKIILDSLKSPDMNLRQSIMKSLFIVFSDLPKEIRDELLARYNDSSPRIRLEFVWHLFNVKEFSIDRKMEIFNKILQKEEKPEVLTMFLVELSFKSMLKEYSNVELLKMIDGLFPYIKWEILLNYDEFRSLLPFLGVTFDNEIVNRIKQYYRDISLNQDLLLDIDSLKEKITDDIEKEIEEEVDIKMKKAKVQYKKSLEFDFEEIFDVTIRNW